MNGLPLFGEESHLRLSFLDMLNDPDLTVDPNLSVGDLTVGSNISGRNVTVNPNVTVQDLVNPVNEYEIRERHRHLAKRRMPYIEKRHFPVTETQSTLAVVKEDLTMNWTCKFYIVNCLTDHSIINKSSQKIKSICH